MGNIYPRGNGLASSEKDPCGVGKVVIFPSPIPSPSHSLFPCFSLSRACAQVKHGGRPRDPNRRTARTPFLPSSLLEPSPEWKESPFNRVYKRRCPPPLRSLPHLDPWLNHMQHGAAETLLDPLVPPLADFGKQQDQGRPTAHIPLPKLPRRWRCVSQRQSFWKKKTTAKIKSQFFFNRFNNVYIFLAPEYDGGVGGYVLRRGETFYPSYHPYYYDLGDGFTRQLDGDGSVINNALVVGGLAALGLGIGEAVVYNQVTIKWMWCCCCCRRRLRSCCCCLWWWW